MTLVAMSVISILLPPGFASRVRDKLHWIFIPLGDGGTYLASAIRSEDTIMDDTLSKQERHLAEENEILRGIIARQQGQLDEYKAGTRVISDLYGPSTDPPVRLVPARVIAADSMPYGWTRVTNAGEDKGAEGGMYVTRRVLGTDRLKRIAGNPSVLCGTVLAGRISESGAYSSRVILVMDYKFQINVRILRIIDPQNPRIIRVGAHPLPLTPEKALTSVFFKARGAGAAGMIIKDVSKEQMIRKGDIVQTCQNDGSIRAAVRIGTVVEVEDNKSPNHVNLRVEPFITPDYLRDLFIVIPREFPAGDQVQ